jgi:aromatic-L-amino-acid decarboxylase
MRRMGHRVVDLLVDRITGLDASPVWRGGDRERLRVEVGETPPDTPADFDALVAHLVDHVMPFAGAVDHPRFFAFIPSCPTWPGLLGDFLARGHSLFQGTWLESAGPSTLELLVLGWFKQWIGYPPSAAGLLTSGGSAANLDAVVCARSALLGADDDGVIYLSTEAHSSMERAAHIVGFRPGRVRKVPTDDAYRMRTDALQEAIAEDRAAGRRPFLIVANGGATSTGAVDPLPELAALAHEQAMWLHVDAAYGGFAVLTERGRRLLDGMGEADSVTLDPHKWLYQPFEAGCLLVREGHQLPDAFHIMPDYLQDAALRAGGDEEAGPDAHEVNFGDRGLQLTRDTRAIKIWLSLRTFGLDAFRQGIDRAMDLADAAEQRIRASATLELLTPATLGVVCFRRRAERAASNSSSNSSSSSSSNSKAGEGVFARNVQPRAGARSGTPSEAQLERWNAGLVARLSESGVGMISSTRLDGRYALRLCVLNHRSGREDVERVLAFLESEPVE